MPEKFSWSKVYSRRRKLAMDIAKSIDITEFSFTAGIKKPFSFDTYCLTDQFLADKKLWELPFYAVACGMIEAPDSHSIIDHAWWLIADDRSGEPWGFVTEPYIKIEKAEKIVGTLNSRYEDYGINTSVFPTDKSAWNPGGTIPIIVLASPGRLGAMLSMGVTDVISRMTHTFIFDTKAPVSQFDNSLVESNIPIFPQGASRKRAEFLFTVPLNNMKYGDSVFFKTDQKPRVARESYYQAKQKGLRVVTRSQDDGIRVWLVAPDAIIPNSRLPIKSP